MRRVDEKRCFICEKALTPGVDGIRVVEVELELGDERVAKMEIEGDEAVYVHTKGCLEKANDLFRRQYRKWEESRVGRAKLN